ncbi:MAG TPA: hypothetical protein VIK72_11955 [Clostridiaceae bacterium]
MSKNKVRKSGGKLTKATKEIQRLKIKLNELEMDIKRVRLEFSWYENNNNYDHCIMNEKIDPKSENNIPF